MKIVFICGSLERGKDGVGDYTRRLASELIVNGCDVRLLALNDKHLVGSLYEVQLEKGQQINTLRLGKNLGWKERAATAKVWVDAFNPSWLSLQLVIYSFQDKGLPLFLGKYLNEIGGDRKWHVMFHELCIGLDEESNLKSRFIGFFQRRIIKQLVKKLKVKKISTQCTLYKEILADWYSQEVLLLPLFSNIERVELQDVQRKIGRFVIFGGIYKYPYVHEFLQDVKDRFGEVIEFVFLGRNGFERQIWIDACEKLQIQYQIIGEVSAKEISEILQTAQYGVSTTPALAIEKSGSFAAYTSHGLIQINVSRSSNIPGYVVTNRNLWIWKKDRSDWNDTRKPNISGIDPSEVSKQLKKFLQK